MMACNADLKLPPGSACSDFSKAWSKMSWMIFAISVLGKPTSFLRPQATGAKAPTIDEVSVLAFP